jgi:TRAP transporter TAXI family solute receptor
MLGLSRRSLFKGLAAIFCIAGIVSLALTYFFPAPPSKVTIATAFKGTTFEYYGKRYRERLARDNVKLELRETEGSGENLSLLQDPGFGVQVAFMYGGISDGEHAPGLLSLGVVYNNAFWIFYSSAEPLDRLAQLKGKRIAVGPVGSGVRTAAEKILGTDGITAATATFLPYGGITAVEALKDGKVDAVWISSTPDSPAIQPMLRMPNVRLLNFTRAEALTRIFPNLVRLILPQGVFDIAENIPPNDVSLIATTVRILIRDDLHPVIVSLLLQTMIKEHGGAGIFQRAGEFPTQTDPEYPMPRAL